MVAGLVVTTAMNPFDVISTRLYTQGTGVAERYTGPLDCAVKTVRAEGFRGVREAKAPKAARPGDNRCWRAARVWDNSNGNCTALRAGCCGGGQFGSVRFGWVRFGSVRFMWHDVTWCDRYTSGAFSYCVWRHFVSLAHLHV